jgi:hypothetical protein
MKKYLGSPIDAYIALVIPIIICFPVPFAASSFSSGIDVTRVMLLFGCILCVAIWCVYLKKTVIQIYAWGYFDNNSVQVKALFTKPFSIVYAKCFGCGIGYYTHGILNSQLGSKNYYIFLSYDRFDEQYRARINLWRPTKTRIKVKFRKELYDFLIAVLPKTQARMLEQDYKQYF